MIKMSKVESAARLVLAFFEAYNRHDVAGMLRLLSDDCTLEAASPAPDGATISGKETIAAYWREHFAARPGARITVEQVYGFGLRCAAVWRREWVDVAGQPQRLRGLDLFLERGGVLCEQRSWVKG